MSMRRCSHVNYTYFTKLEKTTTLERTPVTYCKCSDCGYTANAYDYGYAVPMAEQLIKAEVDRFLKNYEKKRRKLLE